jgi:hypothetical protein
VSERERAVDGAGEQARVEPVRADRRVHAHGHVGLCADDEHVEERARRGPGRRLHHDRGRLGRLGCVGSAVLGVGGARERRDGQPGGEREPRLQSHSPVLLVQRLDRRAIDLLNRADPRREPLAHVARGELVAARLPQAVALVERDHGAVRLAFAAPLLDTAPAGQHQSRAAALQVDRGPLTRELASVEIEAEGERGHRREEGSDQRPPPGRARWLGHHTRRVARSDRWHFRIGLTKP